MSEEMCWFEETKDVAFVPRMVLQRGEGGGSDPFPDGPMMEDFCGALLVAMQDYPEAAQSLNRAIDGWSERWRAGQVPRERA